MSNISPPVEPYDLEEQETSCVALSTTEAEYISHSNASQQCVFDG